MLVNLKVSSFNPRSTAKRMEGEGYAEGSSQPRLRSPNREERGECKTCPCYCYHVVAAAVAIAVGLRLEGELSLQSCRG